jgi:hypothetical protein
LWQRTGHGAERGEDGSVLLLCCWAQGRQLQEALLDLFVLCLAVILGGRTTTFMVIVELAYHVRTAVLLRRPWVGLRAARASLAKLEGASTGQGHCDVLQHGG